MSSTYTPERDQHCATCAYRVNDHRADSVSIVVTMVCLHPQVGRRDCREARLAPNAICGADASLYRAHAALAAAGAQQ